MVDVQRRKTKMEEKRKKMRGVKNKNEPRRRKEMSSHFMKMEKKSKGHFR
jgi:hypothetical protein